MGKKIEKSIILNQSKHLLYDQLFNDDLVQQYMGCHIRQVSADSYEWYIINNHQENIILYGKIIEEIPNQLKTLLTHNPHREYQHKEQLKVTYQFETIQQQSKLTIIQTGFESLPDGDLVYKENLLGWNYALNNLQKIINNK